MTTNNHLNEFTEIDPKTRKDLQEITDDLLGVEHLDLDNRKYLAKALFCLGKYNESLRQFEKVLSDEGYDENIVACIAINHYMKHDYYSALKYLNMGIERNPECECMLTYRMLCHEFLDDYKNAVKSAEALIEINEKNTAAINRIIDYHLELKNYEECLYYMGQIKYLDKYKKALILYKSRRYEECLKETSKIRTAESYYLAGKAHLKLGNIAKAAKYLYKSYEKDYNIDKLFEIAEIYFKADDPKKAIFYLKQVLLHDEENAEAHCRIACAYMEAGDWHDAIEYGRKAIEINKKMPEAYVALARAHMQLDFYNIEKQKEIIEEGLGENPESAELWVEMGNIHFIDNPIEFERSFEKAIRLKPMDEKIYRKYINLLVMSDEKEKAKIHYNQMLLVNPIFEESFKEMTSFWSG